MKSYMDVLAVEVQSKVRTTRQASYGWTHPGFHRKVYVHATDEDVNNFAMALLFAVVGASAALFQLCMAIFK